MLAATLITGLPGAGKSRLIEAWREAAHPQKAIAAQERTQRIAEASRLGYSRILVPQGTRERLDSKVSGIIEVGTLSAALSSR